VRVSYLARTWLPAVGCKPSRTLGDGKWRCRKQAGAADAPRISDFLRPAAQWEGDPAVRPSQGRADCSEGTRPTTRPIPHLWAVCPHTETGLPNLYTMGTRRTSPAGRFFSPVSGCPLTVIMSPLKSQSVQVTFAASVLRNPPNARKRTRLAQCLEEPPPPFSISLRSG
jgi:hypothetical protein